MYFSNRRPTQSSCPTISPDHCTQSPWSTATPIHPAKTAELSSCKTCQTAISTWKGGQNLQTNCRGFDPLFVHCQWLLPTGCQPPDTSIPSITLPV